MLTYVINTSENKTFDTEKLFSLVGYNKIVWINSKLDEINKCAEYIFEKQNVLGADDFRIAVIIDFYNFDRIRLPYSVIEYKTEREQNGVDLSIYYPFIECYLIDNLFEKLSQKNLIISQRDVYYVQADTFEKLENINNAQEQIKKILAGKTIGDKPHELTDFNKERVEKARNEKVKGIVENAVKIVHKESELGKDTTIHNKKINDILKGRKIKTILNKDVDFNYDITSGEDDIDKYTKDQINDLIDSLTPHDYFELYCTENVTLKFSSDDYPYSGGGPINIVDFYDAIIARNKKLRRHYYLHSYFTTTIMAAYNTLNLSLFLIEMYEQEETLYEEGEIKIKKIDPKKLKDLLVTSWNKVTIAKNIAKENKTDYYDIEKIMEKEDEYVKRKFPSVQKTLEEVKEEKEILTIKSIEELYERVLAYASHTKVGMSLSDYQLLNATITTYLNKRDLARENNVDEQFEDEKNRGTLSLTKKCPPKIIYEKLIFEKEQEIADIFKNTLSSEYINVDYTEEKEEADVLLAKYEKLKESAKGKALPTIIFNVIVCLLLLIPYALLQRRFDGIFNLQSILLYIFHGLFFGGILFLSFSFHALYIKLRMSLIKRKLKYCLLSCLKKNRQAMSLFIKRYEQELLLVEEYRFLIRVIKRFKELNDQKEMHVKLHRAELENLENLLSSLLNNLGIEAVVNKNINIGAEFNIDEPINSPNNKVYKIFSIETIEDLFAAKGGHDNES